MNYAYGADGRVASVTLNPVNSNGTGTNTGVTLAVLSGATHRPTGQLAGWTWGDATAYQRSFDAFARLAGYPLGKPGGAGAAAGLRRTLTLDDDGAITGFTHTNGSQAQPAFDQSIGYDCQWSSNNPQLWSSNFPHPSTPRSERWKWKFDRLSSRMRVALHRARGPWAARRLPCPCPGRTRRHRCWVNNNGRRFTSGEREVRASRRSPGNWNWTARRFAVACSKRRGSRIGVPRLAACSTRTASGWPSDAPEVNYSARILWQELRSQRGFTGSYVIVRRAVAPLRMAASVAALTQRRFETGPGEQAQCDWGQITVPLGGVRTEIHIFVMTLGYSRRGFALGFLRERMADLLAAHEAAFAHFGGRCEFLLYDRMRTVVLGTSGGRPRLNPTFAAFAAHWGFTPRLCQPYRAQTKALTS